MAAMDIATVIEEFSADSSRTSFELPHMTTGQRKSTKKLLEQYSDLSCESYGFGAERQLHLFKKCADEEKVGALESMGKDLVPPTVNIKNTFISDWVAPETEPVIFRSLQLKSDQGNLNLASIAKESHQGERRAPSPNGSTSSPSEASTKCQTLDSSRSASDREAAFTKMREEVQVRNTFIHLETASVDQRAIQSMPHGMFRQCLLAEASAGNDTAATPEPVHCCPDTPTGSELCFDPAAYLLDDVHDRQSLTVGSLVMVEGLVKCPSFNGCSAVVQGWDEATGRYSILLASPEGCQEAKIKEQNLRVMLPPCSP